MRDPLLGTKVSRPHASDRRRGRDYKPYQTGLRAHEHENSHKVAKTECSNKFELKYAHRFIHHAQMQFNPHPQRKPTAFIHACIQHVHYILINSKYRIAEVKYSR